MFRSVVLYSKWCNLICLFRLCSQYPVCICIGCYSDDISISAMSRDFLTWQLRAAVREKGKNRNCASAYVNLHGVWEDIIDRHCSVYTSVLYEKWIWVYLDADSIEQFVWYYKKVTQALCGEQNKSEQKKYYLKYSLTFQTETYFKTNQI